MISFMQYLQEAKKFAKAKDSDYPTDDTVLLFDEKDSIQYKETPDKNHGIESHAIKHAIEFDEAAVISVLKQYVNELKTYVKDNPFQFCKIWKRKSKFLPYEGLEAIKKASPDTILSTLDMINDKMANKTVLKPIELLAKNYIKRITNTYEKNMKEKIADAVDIEKLNDYTKIVEAINKYDVIKFYGFQNVAVEYILDFRDNSIIIETPDYIRTMYTFYKPAKSRAGIIKNFLQKHKAENNIIQRALREF